jgi:hypothetical protein
MKESERKEEGIEEDECRIQKGRMKESKRKKEGMEGKK